MNLDEYLTELVFGHKNTSPKRSWQYYAIFSNSFVLLDALNVRVLFKRKNTVVIYPCIILATGSQNLGGLNRRLFDALAYVFSHVLIIV